MMTKRNTTNITHTKSPDAHVDVSAVASEAKLSRAVARLSRAETQRTWFGCDGCTKLEDVVWGRGACAHSNSKGNANAKDATEENASRECECGECE